MIARESTGTSRLLAEERKKEEDVEAVANTIVVEAVVVATATVRPNRVAGSDRASRKHARIARRITPLCYIERA